MFKNSGRFYHNLMYWGGAIIILIAVNVKLMTLDYIVANGRTVLLPLYFADKEDVNNNGYMTIRYENIIPDTNFNENRGVIVVSGDINKVAIYSRFFSRQMPVEIGEFLLKYEVKRPFGFFDMDGMVRVSFGSEKFYFKESGLSEHYLRARYAILKLSEDGTGVLYGLADMNYQDLGRFF